MMMKSDASMQQQLRGGGPGAGPGAGLKTDKSLNKSEQNFLEQREKQRIILQSYEKQRINFDLKLNSDQFRTDTAFIEQVNNDPIGSWTAKHYGSKFEQLTHGDLRKMLGECSRFFKNDLFSTATMKYFYSYNQFFYIFVHEILYFFFSNFF